MLLNSFSDVFSQFKYVSIRDRIKALLLPNTLGL